MANPNAHIHVQFLTQMTVLVGNLGFQSMTDQYKTPCRKYLDKWTIDGAAWSITCWILVIDGKY